MQRKKKESEIDFQKQKIPTKKNLEGREEGRQIVKIIAGIKGKNLNEKIVVQNGLKETKEPKNYFFLKSHQSDRLKN